MNKNKEERLLRGILIFWTLFVGVGALWGSLMMWIDPSGARLQMQPLLGPIREMFPWLHGLFENFIFAGIVLFCVNGITQLLSAWLCIHRHKSAVGCAMVCGAILMLWCAFEWILWGFNLLSNLYFLFGLIEMLTAWRYIYETKVCEIH